MAALFWSLLQNWGGRVVGLVFFVALARLLDPADFGIASSAFLVLTLLHLIAEFGLGDALVQRRGLAREDINLPFFAAVSLSTALAILIIVFAPLISDAMKVEGLAPYLAGAALIGPLMTLSALQEALYRREMLFRPLAIRTLAAGVAGGLVGIAMAWAGLGPWALIGQFAGQMLTSVVWLWLKPVWTPTLDLRPGSARQIGAFGFHVFSTYLLDFVTIKSVDLIILLKGGPVALGLYTVASRLYLLLLQLLQVSISSVGLSMLSKISHDIPRMGKLYLRGGSISAMLGTPVFFGLAALAPEVNHIMFGRHWAGAERLMEPLLLIGGLHCIQYLNSAYLTALGRPRELARIGLAKAVLVLVPLYLWPGTDVAQIVWVYVAALLAVAPLSFHATLRALGLSWPSLAVPVGAPILAAFGGFLAVTAARSFGWPPATNPFVGAIALGALFALVFVAAMALLAFRTGRDNVLFLLGAFRR